MLDKVLETINSRRSQSLADLFEFLRIPSVSTKPEHKTDVARCADWLAAQLQSAGLTAVVHATAGHPIIVAKNEHKSGRPTVLYYGHYDVQPPEPLDQWLSPPFEPTVRKDENGFDAVFGRGTCDDKGQIWAHLEAARAWHEHGGLPVNICLLLEGSEEIGSRNLQDFVAAHKGDLAADVALISDSNQMARGLPAITYGLRGLVYCEVLLTGPIHDLHSGMYGGAVPNPANALCGLLSTLHNADGTINVPGFYDNVVPLTPSERS